MDVLDCTRVQVLHGPGTTGAGAAAGAAAAYAAAPVFTIALAVPSVAKTNEKIKIK